MKKTQSRWLMVGWVGLVMAHAGRAFAADDCATPIKAELASLCGGFPDSTLQPDVSKMPGEKPMDPVQCGKGGPLHVVAFAIAPGAGAKPPARKGMTLDPSFAKWNPVSVASGACAKLVEAVYDPPPAPPAAPPADAPPPPPNNAGSLRSLHAGLVKPLVDKTGPAGALNAIRGYRSELAGAGGLAVDAVPGSSTASFNDAVNETLQILGQIVADRASAQAYALIKDKLVGFLQCQPDYTSPIGFNATCKVIVPLRLQDVAMSRDALLAAVVTDGVGIVQKNRDFVQALGPLLGTLVAGTIVPLVATPQAVLEDSAARTILDTLVTYADKALPSDTGSLTPEEAVVAVGVAAYLNCLTPSQPGDVTKLLGSCDVGANVAKLAGDDLGIIPAATTLAEDLVFIATPTPKGGDVRPRLIRAVDVTFDTSCMLLRGAAPIQPLGVHPVPASVARAAAPSGGQVSPTAFVPSLSCNPPGATIASALDALALVQPIVDEAIDHDTNALVGSIVVALQRVVATLSTNASQSLPPSEERALVLLGGLLDYAATYAAPASPAGTGTSTGTTDGSAHDQRTKILESLTEAMTDRTGREGDFVASLGGSLRLQAGARIATAASGAAILGPLSLPLGVAFTKIPGRTGCRCGFHLELDAIDLGQYLSWDNGPTVTTPQWQDALSPSVTVGVAIGPTMPFVLGATAGYSPTFAPIASRPDAKGAFNVGLVAGVHVPLFDLD